MAKEQKGKKPRPRRGRGEGSIGQLDDGRWCGRLSYTSDGVRHRPVFYGRSKTEVVEAMAAYRQKHASGTAPPPRAKLTVGKYLEDWLAARRPKVATLTYQHYETEVRLHVVPYLGNHRLSALTASHVEDWYARMSDDGVTSACQWKAAGVLSAALRYAVHPLRHIPHSPTAGVPRPRLRLGEMTCLTAAQANRFLDETRDDRLHALFAVWLASGARTGELLALTWADIDWDAKTISLTKSAEETKSGHRVKETKTAKSRRKVVLPEFAVAALEAHRARMQAEGFHGPARQVFCSRRGVLLKRGVVWQTAARLREAANARAAADGACVVPAFRPYDLRHTCASLLLAAGEPVKVVSERLGHANATLTLNVYCHVLPGQQGQAADRLAGVLGR